jgi:GTP-binding protein HflX
MSRLTGGIGGRGPGETKLEINRRRARERIARLEKSLESVRKHREQQKAQRLRKGLPVISIIGYTNAGKSTLLNTLTQSNVIVERRLFATLDPSSRRLRFPRDMEVIITDTVGFIRDLPKDLMVAFRATLEELENANLLLHVIDISNPRYEEQINSVERILADLNLQKTATIRVLNKMDLIDPQTSSRLSRQLRGTAISARSKSTLRPLVEKMETIITEVGLRPVGEWGLRPGGKWECGLRPIGAYAYAPAGSRKKKTANGSRHTAHGFWPKVEGGGRWRVEGRGCRVEGSRRKAQGKKRGKRFMV